MARDVRQERTASDGFARPLALIADDLTGALDTAAEFVALTGPVDVRWDAASGGASLALDSGTRELSEAQALVRLKRLAPLLKDAKIAYKKVDSLLRGHVMAELAACWRLGLWDHCVIAPAFPFQGRVTRAGAQYAREGSAWRDVANIEALAHAAGLDARRAAPHAPLARGASIFDAESDADLAQIAALGRAASGRVLWCGSAGLAQALVGAASKRDDRLVKPVLGLFGSDQAVTARQLAACGSFWSRLPDGGESSAEALQTALIRDGAAFASLALPEDTPREIAAARISDELGALARRLPRPGTLIVAGGETLRALCDALGATHLRAVGQVEPGLPRSLLQGGRWDGLPVISKSGAFGPDGLWRDLLLTNGLGAARTST